MNADKLEELANDLIALPFGGDRDRELIKAMLSSIAIAMARVPNSRRAKVQDLVQRFCAYPEDADTVASLGEILKDSTRPSH
jgi:hypothetical protein